MNEQKLSDAWQCQSCGCYFPHIPKVLDDDIKRCSKCVEVEILEAKLEGAAHCNLGHEMVPLDLWTCPICHEELDRKLHAIYGLQQEFEEAAQKE